MVNRYAGDCGKCGARVPAKAGVVEGSRGAFRVFHTACREGGPGVVVSTFFGERGATTTTVNARGRCIDAPCCGCCS